MLKPYKQTKTQNKANDTNLVDGVELVRVVEGPPPVGRGRVGINFAVHLHNSFDVDVDVDVSVGVDDVDIGADDVDVSVGLDDVDIGADDVYIGVGVDDVDFGADGVDVREGLNEKKTFSFGHCPNHLTPDPNSGNLALFFGHQNSKFESHCGEGREIC